MWVDASVFEGRVPREEVVFYFKKKKGKQKKRKEKKKQRKREREKERHGTNTHPCDRYSIDRVYHIALFIDRLFPVHLFPISSHFGTFN